MTEPVYVGVDLGTSAMKGVAVAGSGKVLARARAPYVTRRPSEGAAEQDPADWLSALSDVVGALGRGVDPSRWQAIGLSGMLPTLVLLDAAGRAIGPAVTWQDGRAEDDGARLSTAIGPVHLYELTGQRVDGRYLLPMYRRAAMADPEGAGRARQIVGAKDYLYAHLTGRVITDPSTATGFGCYGLDARSWLDEVVEAATASVPVRPGLPDVEPSASHHPIRAELARGLGLPSGLPIVLGGADSALGALALGARRRGEVAFLAGTSSVVLGVSDDAPRDPERRYLITPLAGVDGFGLEMDLLATGSALGWLAGLLGLEDAAEVLALATAADPATAPVFLPYLAPGEQGALWEPGLSGAVLGLHLASTREDLARGLLSGIVLEARRCLGVLDEVLGATGPVLLAGPGSGAEPLPRDLADASRRPVRTAGLHPGDHSSFGAAILSARALGGELATAPGQPALEWEPTPDRAALWERLAERHEQALDAIRGAPAAPHADDAKDHRPLASERSRHRER